MVSRRAWRVVGVVLVVGVAAATAAALLALGAVVVDVVGRSWSIERAFGRSIFVGGPTAAEARRRVSPPGAGRDRAERA